MNSTLTSPDLSKTRVEWIEERDDALSDRAADDFGEVDSEGPLGDYDSGYGPNSYFASAMLKDDQRCR